VDISSKLSFSYAYKSPSSTNTKDFFQKLEEVFPFLTRQTEIQTDNGSEFLRHFEDYLRKKEYKQVWNYVRSPKMNAFIERRNGTVQVEFIYRNLSLLFNPEDTNLTRFNQKLMQHLIWYNTERPHLSLDLKSPMEYLLQHQSFSKMWWTRTRPCQYSQLSIY
jgi:transposase InsO family protein